MTKHKAWWFFAAFCVAHFVLWVTIFNSLSYSLHLDTVESFYWGNEMQLGYHKHPPLFAWYANLFSKTLGNTLTSAYIASQVLIILTFLAVFLYALDVLNPMKAMLSVISLELILHYNILSQVINANTILTPLWAFAAYFYHRSLKYNKLLDFILFGTFCALCMLGKYFSVFLFLSFGIHAIFYAKLLKNPKLYAAISTFLIIISIHLVWLIQHNFLPFRYLLETRGSFSHSSIVIILSAFSRVLALILIFTIIFRPKMLQIKEKWHSDKLIFFIALAPSILFFLYITILNIHGVDKWLTPCFSFVPMFLFVVFDRISNEKLVTYMKTVLCFAFIIFPVVGASRLAFSNGSGQRMGLDAKYTAHIIENLWMQKHNTPPKYISGNVRHAGNIAYFMKQTPQMIIDGDLVISPWIDKNDLYKQDVLLVWKDESDSREILKNPQMYTQKINNKFDIFESFEIPIPNRLTHEDVIVNVAFAKIKQ